MASKRKKDKEAAEVEGVKAEAVKVKEAPSPEIHPAEKECQLLAQKRVEENEIYLRSERRLMAKVRESQREVRRLKQEIRQKSRKARATVASNPFPGMERMEATVDEVFVSADEIRSRLSQVESDERIIIIGSQEVISVLRGEKVEDEDE